MNNSNQQAYDRGTSLYSPDGRIYQVEYAREAVKRGAPVVGIRAADGVVLAARTRSSSPLMVTESIEKLHKVDDHVGAASAGHVADARRLVDYARQEAQVNRLRYGEPAGVEALTKEVTDFIQENTQRGGTRPFGAALLVAGVDATGPRLFETDPSGTPHEWKAVAIGGESASIREYLEDAYDPEMSVDDGVSLAVEALLEGADGDEIAPESVSLSTVSESAHHTYDADEIATVIDGLDLDSDDE
ncbi:proteasome subunit alpha [Haloprofundus marisrubri]|uniref:Proteasome subunit alpha n=1 Tax=Haloprofundus marisrubri TaxID=1514971 RepID=A0A0W1R503_9EURY|nr:archaeal proteasome endopeptidase complex subunit alpha [Haloprofundus marisrubri]KTG08378.1 proteasome subunit alpha [Haloprofundus marisrubri]